MKLIIGLGNPGKNYIDTRHNVGFMFLDYLASRKNLKFRPSLRFPGKICKEKDFILAKPETYMNLSGSFVIKIVNYFKIDISKIIIIYDDLVFNVGQSSFKEKGSSNGQNGMKDIIQNLKTSNLKRIKIGIGPYNDKFKKPDFVLSKLSPSEIDELRNNVFPKIEHGINLFLDSKTSQAITFINES